VLVALILSIAAQTAPSTTSASTPPPSTARASIELLSALSAQGTTSNVDTALTSWLGVRVGGVNTDQGGLFFGGDGTVSVGVENAGTADVAYGRVPALLEGRGLVGARLRRGFVGLGGYGYGGAGVGLGAATITVFDKIESRGFVTTTIRAGIGAETSLGPVMLRLETGAGVRDLRFEIHGSAALGVRW